MNFNFINPNNKLIGVVSNTNKNKYDSFSYRRGKELEISKRRAKNKVARKARRLNRIRKETLHCKFYK